MTLVLSIDTAYLELIDLPPSTLLCKPKYCLAVIYKRDEMFRMIYIIMAHNLTYHIVLQGNLCSDKNMIPSNVSYPRRSVLLLHPINII